MKFLCVKTWVAMLLFISTVAALQAKPETCMSCITPTTLSVSQPTGTGIKLQWGIVSGASLYSIEVENGNGNTAVFKLVNNFYN